MAVIAAGATLAGVVAQAVTTAWMERRRLRQQLAAEHRAASADRMERVRQLVVEVVTRARDTLDLNMIKTGSSEPDDMRSVIEESTSALLAAAVDLASLDPALGRIAEDIRLAVFEHVNPHLALRSEEEVLEAANSSIDQLLDAHAESRRAA